MNKIQKQKIWNGNKFVVVSDMNDVKNKMSRPTEVFATLLSSNWERSSFDGYFYQTVAIDILSESNDIVVSLSPSASNDAKKERLSCGVECVEIQEKQVRFKAAKVPQYDIEYKFLIDVAEAQLNADLIRRINEKISLSSRLDEIDIDNIINGTFVEEDGDEPSVDVEGEPIELETLEKVFK